MQRRLVQAATLLTCGFVTWLVVLSNHYDWDVFYALNEVDRRSWLIDHEIPLWTYQLCAGMSRLGDPQAFGTSPLFVLVLLFGSFWGTKLWVIASMLIAVCCAARLFELCQEPERERPGPWAPHLTSALLLVFSNFFLWHLLVGHFTFSVVCLGLAIIYFTLAGYWRGLSRAELALAAMVAWQHYAGGFFHSFVYLIVPFAFAFALFVPLDLWQRRRTGLRAGRTAFERLANVRGALGFQAIGLLLALPKIWAVWSHAQAHSRDLGTSEPEAFGLGQVALHVGMPTLQFDWLVPSWVDQRYAVHEYSSFSLLIPLALVAVAMHVGARAFGSRPEARRSWNGAIAFAALYLGVSVVLSLGDGGPFAWLNEHLFRGAVRVPSRFEIGAVLASGMLFVALSRAGPARRLGAPPVRLALLLLLALNIATFLPLTSTERLREVLAYPAAPHTRMSDWNSYPIYPAGHRGVGGELDRTNTSQMYAHVLSGLGIDNCYNAMPITRMREPATKRVPLVEGDPARLGRKCIEQSYYTQNRVMLDASCPEFTCINVAGLNPADSDFTNRPEYRGRYCRQRAASGER